MAFFFRSTWGILPGMLSPSDIADLSALRRVLHRHPEISGEEAQTAARIAEALRGMADGLVTDLGGHGVAAIFNGATAGPTLLFRCELDALPIQETDRSHQSLTPGKAHLCGHDGHMTILIGLARLLAAQRPARGRVVLMFQPSEETGVGGPAVVADPKFAPLKPDRAFALHNMPGLPLGYVGLTVGPVASASRGIELQFRGKEAHSAYPESATSPRGALSHLMVALQDLTAAPERRVTVTHVSLGQPNFGITPGQGRLFATLRSRTNDGMASLVAEAEALAQRAAQQDGLDIQIIYHEIFEHLENAPDAVAILTSAVQAQGLRHGTDGGTMVPSEDFAAFSHDAPSAMLYLGSGEEVAALHHPDYDFPDALIPIGAHLFEQVVRDQLG